jgi:hypothetical protein
MAFGRPDTEQVWREVYEPAATECGLKAVRVDREDDGTLLPSQITQWLNNATMIIGDLTHERPNCYLEIGFGMGLNRYDSLLLACRADHNLHAANRTAVSPKIHFDLQSYGILWWDIGALAEFKSQLADKMRRRLANMPHPTVVQAVPRIDSRPALDRIFDEHERR